MAEEPDKTHQPRSRAGWMEKQARLVSQFQRLYHIGVESSRVRTKRELFVRQYCQMYVWLADLPKLLKDVAAAA